MVKYKYINKTMPTMHEGKFPTLPRKLKNGMTTHGHVNRASILVTSNLPFKLPLGTKKVRPIYPTKQCWQCLRKFPTLGGKTKFHRRYQLGLVAFPPSIKFQLSFPPWPQIDKAHIPIKQCWRKFMMFITLFSYCQPFSF